MQHEIGFVPKNGQVIGGQRMEAVPILQIKRIIPCNFLTRPVRQRVDVWLVSDACMSIKK